MNILEKLNIPDDLVCENGWLIKSKNSCVATCDENLGELIAAAPEMLEALIKSCLIDMTERGCTEPPYCNRGKSRNCISPCYTLDKIKLIEIIKRNAWVIVESLKTEEIKSLMED